MTEILETVWDVVVFTAIVLFCISVSDSLRRIALSLARQAGPSGARGVDN